MCMNYEQQECAAALKVHFLKKSGTEWTKIIFVSITHAPCSGNVHVTPYRKKS